MNLSTVLDQLRTEMACLDAAILSLERLQIKSARRGRPPKALAELRRKQRLAPTSVQRRRTGSPS